MGGNFVGDAFWFYPPRDLLYNVGRSYPVGVVSDAYYERYEKKAGATGTLSHNSNNFTRVGERYTVPLERLASNSYQDSGSQGLWGNAGGLFQMSGGPTRDEQRQQMLKKLENNEDLNRIIRLNNNPKGPYPSGSYSHILTISKGQNFAYKYHVKMRLKDDVTAEQARTAGAMAVSAKAGAGTTAYEAYVYAARGTRLVTKPDAQIDPIQGLTVTKTVGDTLGDPNDPANSGYVRHKENKSFPGGMTWSWQNGVKPTSTAKAGVFKYKVIATYQDGTTSEDKGSGSDGTVTLIVRPTAPTITTAPQYSGTLVSTDRVISGTGAAGATVKVTLQDGTTGTTTVNNQGKWTYTLKANEKLTQNTKSDATIKADNAISVTQTQNGAESEASTVNVQLAKAISIDTPVQAGREITVSVAHDTGRFYVQVYNNRNDQRAAYEYGVKQENGRWVLETGSDKTDLVEVNTNNVSDKKFTLRIKDANKKTNFPFKITANSVVKVRSHHINNKNNPANPANDPDGGWVTASPATNTNPTITVKAPNTRNYTADGSLTMAGLKNLVTVADAEDDANKTVGNTVSDNLNVTIRKGNETVTLSGNEYLKKGDYTLTYTTTDAAGVRVEKTHTITVSSLAESKGTSITYPVDTAKVVYGNSDVTNGNFTPAIKQTFANKLTEVNRGNNNLPTINGTGVTFAPGTTNDKAKVVVATFPDGSTLDISHDKVAKPAAPTITPSANFEGDLGSTERSISGTGIAGATVKIALQDGKTGEATVGSDGRWTYNLKAGETLKQNYKQDATTKATSPVSVKQVANGIESAATTANVRLGYVISFDTPVQAGRDITVRVPHDGAKFYVVIAGKEGRYEYGLTKTASGWQLTEPNGATTTEVTEEAGANASEKVVKLHIKDSNKKTNIPYTIPSATRSIMARMHYDNSAGNPSGGWVFAPDATNTNPTITVKAPNTRNYTADGSLTMAGLKNLVTVGDAEDDANKTVGNTVSDNLNVTIRKGNETVTLSGNEYLKKGEYTLTYTTTDAAGVSVTKEHTITVSSLAESKGTSITYPVDTAKVVYGNSDVTNGNFTPAIKQTFANKLTEVNRGNNNLPTINGTGVTFAPGTTNDKAKVVVATFPDGSTLDISHDKVAKPAAPTITPSANFEGDLGSTERSISGTGIAGATVKIALQDGKTGEATVGSDGRWTYNLKAGETLKQNYKQDATTKATSPVSVKQVANGIESAATTANVRLGYVISFDTPVQAGRDITVRVPHDGAKFYVVIAGKEGRYEYGLTKTASGWQLTEPNGATTTEVTEEAGANASEKVVKLHIKDSNKKTNIPYTIPSATRSIMARMHYDNSAGNPSGGWVFAPDATNTNPTITVKAPNTRNYTADGSLTMAGLKNLVTVADAEDDANKTVGNTVSDNLNVTIRKGNETVTLSGNEYLKKGDYTLTYTTTDAAGVRVEKTHNITVSSIPEVSIKAAKDATAQGIVPTTESNKVINSVTIPSNQPQPISKVLKDNGRITEVDGEKVATVVLTYSDNSTKEVTVPVLEVKPIDIVTTFNEKDNTVTIKPNTTVEINDRLQFGIRGKSMALTKTASGYTNSVNDRTITVNQDGSITITLVGEEKFQAGDRIVTRHESNKNGKVDSYETEAFSGLKPVEKVPVINLTNLTPKEKEDVKAAVKKANPSVNTAELEVAANGDVTYRHKGAGVGTSDPTPEIRLNGNVIKKPSVPEIKTSLEGKANTNTPVEVEVKSDAGTTVKLYDVTGKEIGSATADSNGTARITVSEKIPVGNVTAKAVSPEGVNSELSAPKKATDTTKPNAPEITSDLTGKANTNSPVTVSVKAEPGSTVKLYDKDNHEIGTGTAGDDGVATITVANNIPVGDVTAKATDASGNVSDPSAPKGATDTTKPNAPEITSDLTGKANTNSPVTVSVKAEPGSTVKLYDKDNHEIGTGTAGDDGVATITVANNIPVGDVTAKATDASGNVSDPSAPKGATDTTKPNAPEITSDLTGKANTNSPVTVSVKAEPGSTVKLYDKDNHEIGTGTAGDDG
ncbi:hypothetical protein SMNM65_07580 [Streptococcus mitis]|uniref:Surface anchored protein n=1 Tax=Streptococcus mitis TaxID=28037 RepID=A0A7G1IY87_STRMT|nr:hypothetical protein SMNM65_07580 [Streptococcus mitis]